MNTILIRGNEVATKAYVDSLALGGSGDITLDDYYTKSDTDYVIDTKIAQADISSKLTNYYNKNEVDTLLEELDNPTQFTVMPAASAENVNMVVQYIGTTNANYINGYFYKSIIETSEGDSSTYKWIAIPVQEVQDIDLSQYYTKEEINNIIAETNNSTQVEEMPEASEENKGTIVQYIGDTNNTYITGYFYQVVEKTIINEDGSETTIYVWEEIKSPEISLDDYATKEYVDEAVANVEAGGGSADLSNIYTKAEVDAKLDEIETLPIIKYEEGYEDKVIALINKFKQEKYPDAANINNTGFAFILQGYTEGGSGTSTYLISLNAGYNSSNRIFLAGGSIYREDNGYIGNVNTAMSVSFLSIVIIGTWTDGIFTKTSFAIKKQWDKIFGQYNDVEWTPDRDYGIVHKKYVDDIVGDINSILDTINGEEV